MFAFALWDARRRRLVIGRDRLGIKPLYVWQRRPAAALRAARRRRCLTLPGVRRRARPRRAASLPRSLATCPRPQSMFRGMRKLPPATLLVVESGRVERAALLAIAGAVDTRRPRSEWIERVRARLEESVRMQMVSDVPIGAFLSGGVDSSAVVALHGAAQRASRSRPTRSASTAAAAEAFYNELPYARQVARAVRHRPPRDPRAPGRRRAAAAAALAHGRADRRHRLHHDLSRLASSRAAT